MIPIELFEFYFSVRFSFLYSATWNSEHTHNKQLGRRRRRRRRRREGRTSRVSWAESSRCDWANGTTPAQFLEGAKGRTEREREREPLPAISANPSPHGLHSPSQGSFVWAPSFHCTSSAGCNQVFSFLTSSSKSTFYILHFSQYSARVVCCALSQVVSPVCRRWILYMFLGKRRRVLRIISLAYNLSCCCVWQLRRHCFSHHWCLCNSARSSRRSTTEWRNWTSSLTLPLFTTDGARPATTVETTAATAMAEVN